MPPASVGGAAGGLWGESGLVFVIIDQIVFGDLRIACEKLYSVRENREELKKLF